MKYLVTLICCFLFSCNAYAEICGSAFFYYDKNHQVDSVSIPVYKDYNSKEPESYVVESNLKEYWHDLFIIDKRGKRFLVEINDPWERYKRIFRWVDKCRCAGYILPIEEVDEDYEENQLYQIYRKRGGKSYRIFKYSEFAHFAVQILDYSGEWVKIRYFLKDGRTGTGWINKICGNIYGCEGN